MRYLTRLRIDGWWSGRLLAGLITTALLAACGDVASEVSTLNSTSTTTAPTNAPTTTALEVPSTSGSSSGAIEIEGIDFDPPTGGPFVEFGYDYYEYVVACAAHNGEKFNLSEGSPGIWINPTTIRTRPVREACMELASNAEWIIPSPFDGTEESNRLMYRLWLDVHDCLVANGYPTVDPPSEDAFADSGPDLWNPYKAMLGAPTSGGGPGNSPAVVEQLDAQTLCGANYIDLYEKSLQQADG